MNPAVDREELLAERSASVVAHLDRVAAALPADPEALTPMSSATDTVVLHLWQAIQVVIDLATAACVRLGLGSPRPRETRSACLPAPTSWTPSSLAA